jgi:hypothetical protein
VIAVEETTRQLVDAWLAGFTWTTAPNVSARAHTAAGATSPATEEDDCAPDLPTLAFELNAPADEILLNHSIAREDSPTDQIVYEHGRAESAGQFVFKCRSEAEANEFKREFRSNAWLSMQADGETKMPVVKRLDGTFLDAVLGVPDHIRVMLSPTGFISHPTSNNTAVDDTWILRHAALVSYPLLEIEPPPGSGRMCVVINHQRCE